MLYRALSCCVKQSFSNCFHEWLVPLKKMNFAVIDIAEGVAEIGLAEQRLLSLGVCNDTSLLKQSVYSLKP